MLNAFLIRGKSSCGRVYELDQGTVDPCCPNLPRYVDISTWTFGNTGDTTQLIVGKPGPLNPPSYILGTYADQDGFVYSGGVRVLF